MLTVSHEVGSVNPSERCCSVTAEDRLARDNERTAARMVRGRQEQEGYDGRSQAVDVCCAAMLRAGVGNPELAGRALHRDRRGAHPGADPRQTCSPPSSPSVPVD